MDKQQKTAFSKTISYALRHAPEEFGLTLDDSGWASLDVLLASIHARGWTDASAKDIEDILLNAEKKRFEIDGNRIRAYYGHSVETKILKNPTSPPEILYHGTIITVLDEIRASGLKPMSRQYVHLSTDIPTAKQVASRRKGEQVVLKIAAQKAHIAGIKFYQEDNDIWLADHIPAQFIEK
jgi:putative RNA 2'-phosphotransferase